MTGTEVIISNHFDALTPADCWCIDAFFGGGGGGLDDF